MQKGIATIEIIFVTVIISVLLSAAFPIVAQIIDRAALDYETKRLYSELRYLQAISRIEDLKNTGTGRENDVVSRNQTIMEILPAIREYKILRKEIPVRQPHKMLPNIKKITTPQYVIIFDSNGTSNVGSNSIYLTSYFGKANRIVFDSVGRIRGGRFDD